MKIKKGVKQAISKFLLIGIGVVVAFYLFFIYIQQVFTSEVESKLIEAANARAMALSTNLNSADEISILSIESSESYFDYFNGNCNYYIVDTKGKILQNKADIVRDSNNNYVDLKINFDEEPNKGKRIAITESLISDNHAVESFLLENGDYLHIGIVPMEGSTEYYSVSMVLDSIIKEQLKPLWRVITIICVLMGFTLIIGVSYYYAKKYLRYRRKFQQSGEDELTGLSNRVMHQREVSGHFNQKEQPYAYVVLSVSNYNFMNEFFGYDYGDSIIKFVADCLISDIKQGEALGRISITEFGMLLEYSDELSFRHRLVKMIKKASNITTSDFNNLNTIVFSCGVSVVRAGDSYYQIKDRAEMARKNAKLEAKYNIIFYEDSIHKQRLEEELLQSEMVEALNNQEFRVFLQPKFSTGKEQLIGAEALIRWLHPQKGMLYPSVFIPLFEANGFMKQIDLFVLTELCKLQFQRRYEGKTEISMSMNISSQLLREKDIVKLLLEIVDSYGLPHHCLEFEISETLVYECQDHIKEIVNELKQAGFFVSLNNFGSGYSSVETFKNIPFDVIKLDKDLLKDFNNAENQTDDKMIITHIISMAKELKLEVLAKGVETDGQKKFIEESKCDMIQGFFYAKPMPFEVFNDYA